MDTKQKQTGIHETIVKDLLDFMNDVKSSDLINFAKKAKKNDFKSLSSKVSGLTLVFPIYTSTAVNIDTASMIAKAQERQAVSMLQLLFAAVNISSSEDGFDFIKQFHGNIKDGEMSVDKFMDIMDELPFKENAMITQDQYKNIKNDLRNLNFYFQEDFSKNSLNDYKILGENFRSYDGTPTVIIETPKPPIKHGITNDTLFTPNVLDYVRYSHEGEPLGRDDSGYYRAVNSYEKLTYDIHNNDRDYKQRNQFHDDDLKTKDRFHKDDLNSRINDFNQKDQFHKDEIVNKDRDYAQLLVKNAELARNNKFKNEIDYRKDRRDEFDINRKSVRDKFNDQRDRIINQLIENDVKKANELIPTIMVVNFTKIIIPADDNNRRSDVEPIAIPSQLLIGVKAKIYAISSTEMINRIIIKNQDNNGLMKLVKASTREISFLSDFLFAIDRAKIDALAKSKKGSEAKIFKVLERRANSHKFKRRIGVNNADVAPISTFHITKEEVDLIKKMSNIDVSKTNVIRSIMESYNLMCFVITDESAESASFIYDTGDDFYESLSYRSLERESADNSAKKMINLMTKIAR